MKTVSKLVFIGAGNMAEALIKGLLSGKVIGAGAITATDVRQERLDELRHRYDIATSTDNREAATGAGLVVLAIKPQQLAEALEGIRGAVPPEALIVSIVAGKLCATIERALGDGTRVVRVMPNTPALVGSGASALCGGRWATARDLTLAGKMLKAVGTVVQVEESMMDAVTALSGSGPAYVFHLAEAMLEAARRMGMDPQVARTLTIATIEGAAKLMAGTGEPPEVLRERVTSKGGTTAAALEVMRQRGLFDAAVDAIRAAEARSAELSAG